jgi:hypothetical protein
MGWSKTKHIIFIYSTKRACPGQCIQVSYLDITFLDAMEFLRDGAQDNRGHGWSRVS